MKVRIQKGKEEVRQREGYRKGKKGRKRGEQGCKQESNEKRTKRGQEVGHKKGGGDTR